MGLALGGIIALLLYAGFSGRSFIETLDLNFPLVALTTIGIWLGAQVAGLGYGPIHTQEWWVLPVTDAAGDLLPRVPYSAFGALISLLLLILIDRIWQTKNIPKVKLLLFCLLEFGLIFGFTYLRADPHGKVWQPAFGKNCRGHLLPDMFHRNDIRICHFKDSKERI